MKFTSRHVCLLLGTALTLVSSAASAKPRSAARHRPTASIASHHASSSSSSSSGNSSRSVGSPTHGRLEHGARLMESDSLRFAPAYAGSDARYGTSELVHMISRAAHAVRHKHTDAVLSVGHLSKPAGGEIDRHHSHESGRDADLGFFVKSTADKPMYGPGFVAFDGTGRAKSWPGAHFDDAKNWSLVEALLSDPQARITHIFVAQPLKDRLLAYASRVGVREAMRERARELLAQPRGALPHDDHFHVRIACPRNDQGCVENPEKLTAHLGRKPGFTRAKASGGHSAAAASGRARPHTVVTPRPAPKSTAHAQVDDERQASKAPKAATEESVPRLGPIVPGLDSVVIPVPLAAPEPLDDVDGE